MTLHARYRRPFVRGAAVATLLAVIMVLASMGAAAAKIRATKVKGGLNQPIAFTFAPDGTDLLRREGHRARSGIWNPAAEGTGSSSRARG